MEIKIKNFGPIKEVGIDLSKDLTILYGKNNIGKSYAISLIYLILKHFLNIEKLHFEESIISDAAGRKYPEIEEKLPEEKEQDPKGETVAKKFDIKDEIIDIMKNFFNKTLSVSLENSLKNNFGKLRNLKHFKSQETPIIQLTLPYLLIHFVINKKVEVEKLSLKKNVSGEYSPPGHMSSFDGDEFILYIGDDFKSFKGALNIFLWRIIQKIRDKIKEEIEGIYFLPAFRSGIYSGSQSFFPMLAELSKKRAFITEKIELPRMPEPTADYILHLSEISRSRTGNKKFAGIIDYLERDILKGEVDFDSDTKRLIYRPAYSGLVLEMGYVSSMVAELSPIVAFLKFVLPGDLENLPEKNGKIPKPVIFIEEPEAHLHPEAQVKLVEIFLKLLEAGVKLIITSHSNYIFNKLNNMILAEALDYNKFAPIRLQDTKNGSVGKLLKTDDLGIEDENFMETADSLYEERENILDRLNNEADDQ